MTKEKNNFVCSCGDIHKKNNMYVTVHEEKNFVTVNCPLGNSQGYVFKLD